MWNLKWTSPLKREFLCWNFGSLCNFAIQKFQLSEIWTFSNMSLPGKSDAVFVWWQKIQLSIFFPFESCATTNCDPPQCLFCFSKLTKGLPKISVTTLARTVFKHIFLGSTVSWQLNWNEPFVLILILQSNNFSPTAFCFY